MPLGLSVRNLLFVALLASPLASMAEEDPSIACNRELAGGAAYSSIASRLPLDSMLNVSFAMLADDKKPDAAQRKAIASWATAHKECGQLGEAFRTEHYPPQVTATAVEADNQLLGIAADLYNRKFTFGDANKQIQRTGDEFRKRLAVFVQEATTQKAAEQQRNQELQAAQARQDEANRQAAAIANQQARERQAAREEQMDFARRQAAAQIIMNNMNANRPAPLVPYLIPQRPITTTNCMRNGEQMSCTSQ